MSPATPASPAWQRFVAFGDSFTEGLDDPLAGGGFRGWADLVAAELARRSPGLCYANLAVRGSRFDAVARHQLPAAVRLRPDLTAFSAGGNDALRRGFDLDDLMTRFEDMVVQLRLAGSEVVLFRFPDMSVRLPMRRVLRPRIIAMNDAVTEIAARREAHLVDLFGDRGLDHAGAWSTDRLHLNQRGHLRVADQVLATLGAGEPPAPVPAAAAVRWPAARAADLRWAQGYLTPWLHRRLTGRSSGEGLHAKRPDLLPVP